MPTVFDTVDGVRVVALPLMAERPVRDADHQEERDAEHDGQQDANVLARASTKSCSSDFSKRMLLSTAACSWVASS